MNKNLLLLLVLVLSLVTSNTLQAQCIVTPKASATSIFCGDSVSLTATSNVGTYVFSENFNSGTFSTGWDGGPSGTITSTTCVPNPGGGNYLWMGPAAANPRTATSKPYDMRTGGVISFDMRFAKQGDASPCEGPDLEDEGVFLQYTTDGGTNWNTIEYYSPRGGVDAERISWTTYYATIPTGAKTANTKIRWHQPNASPPTLPSDPWVFDHWGIDNVNVITNNPSFVFKWAHTGVEAGDAKTPKVAPNKNTTYTISLYDTSGVTDDSCSASITVNAALPVATAFTLDPILCPDGNARLNVSSSLVNPVPTVCALESYQGCDATRSTAKEITKTYGNTVPVYNGGEENPFGDFGTATYTAQYLYKATDLTALGMSAGQISSLSFIVDKIQANGSTSSTFKNVPNFRISITCSGLTTMSSWVSGLNLVYGPKTQKVAVGRNDFFFDKAFSWDGTSNIVVQICWYYPDGESSSYNGSEYPGVRGGNPGYQSVRASTTNFSDGFCDQTNIVKTANFIPNTIFGFCEPKNPVLEYSWSPAGMMDDFTKKNPTATLQHQTTTFKVTVKEAGADALCAVTDSVKVTVQKPQIAFTPSNATICQGDTAVIKSTITPIGDAISPKYFSRTGDQAIPDASLTEAPGVLNSTINVTGITPAVLAANGVVKVCFTIDHDYIDDISVALVSPSGQERALSNRKGGTGQDYVNTCFTLGATTAIAAGTPPYTGNFIPDAALTGFAGDNVNGNWTLRVRDNVRQRIGIPPPAPVTGVLKNWNIELMATQPNFISGFSWTPPATLNRTDTTTVKAFPTANTYYKVNAADAAGCSTTDSVLVTVLPVTVPTISISESKNNICAGEEVTFTASITNGGTTPAYQWKVNGGNVGSNQATFTSSSLNHNDQVTCVLTPSTPCSNPAFLQSSAVSMVVNAYDDANFNYPQATYCSNETGTVSPVGPTTGGGIWTITPATAGFNTSNGEFTPVAMTGGVGDYTIKYVTSSVCPDSSDLVVSLVSTVNAEFTYGKADYCKSESNPAPIHTSGTAGAFTASPTGLKFTNTSTGRINLLESTPNTYMVYNTIVSSGDCGNAIDSFEVTINALPSPAFTGLSADYCIGAGTVATLVPTVAGGSFSGPGVSGTSFDVDAAGIGTHNIKYIVSNVAGCVDSSTQTVTVNALPDPSFTGLSSKYCVDAPGNVLAPTTSGGTFYGLGMSSNYFTPSNAGVGTPTIKYIVSNGFGCVDSSSQSTKVNALPDASFTGLESDYCIYDSKDTLAPVTLGGVFTGKGMSGLTFNPAVAGKGIYTIIYDVTDSNGCASSSQQAVEVHDRPELTVNPDYTICAGDTIELSAVGTGAFSWTPAGSLINPNSINPKAYPDTTTTYTVVLDNGFCVNSKTALVEVNPIPKTNAGADVSKCPQDVIQLIGSGGSGAASYVWTPATGLNNPNSFNPFCNVTTTTTYTLQVTDKECSATDEVKVTVDPLPTASFTYNRDTTYVEFFGTDKDGITAWIWDFDDRSPISTKQNPTHAYAQQDTFTVRLIVINPCGRDTVYFGIRLDGGKETGGGPGGNVAVKENSNLFGVKVFPNPFQDQFTLSVDLKEAGELFYDVYDLQGRKIVSNASEFVHAGNNNIQINQDAVRDYAGNVLLLHLRINGDSEMIKMLKY